jgi:hypothetical protein
MKSTDRLLLAFFMSPACATAWALAPGVMQVGGATRIEVRRAVEMHRASQQEEMRREEAAAGRRLTPAELGELRSQVRGAWSPRYDAPRADAATSPAPGISPPRQRSLTLPRSQRP